jgi:hypothetical protein
MRRWRSPESLLLPIGEVSAKGGKKMTRHGDLRQPRQSRPLTVARSRTSTDKLTNATGVTNEQESRKWLLFR